MDPVVLHPLVVLRPVENKGRLPEAMESLTLGEPTIPCAAEPAVAGTPIAQLRGAEDREAADIECRSLSPPRIERTGLLRTVGRGIAIGCSRLFGAVSLIVGLAVLAAIPIVQFLALGYLLESAGRIARSGRLRDAFPGVRLASRIGGIVLGGWIVTLPWRYVAVLATDSALIDSESTQTRVLGWLVLVFAVLMPLHLVLTVARGGRLRYFFRPIQNVRWLWRQFRAGGSLRDAWARGRESLRRLRLGHYFWLGLRGFVGAFAWLAVPTTLIAAGRNNGLAVLGSILLVLVLLYLPFLQVRFSAENRLAAMFQVSAVRERFRRAPIAFFFALLVTLVLALPLYLLKIEVVPRDAMWLPALVFIVTIFPMKILAGWAYARAGRRPRRAWFITRLGCRLLMLPVATFYAFVVFLTQYTGWHGVASLYEHHAFLLPVPF